MFFTHRVYHAPSNKWKGCFPLFFVRKYIYILYMYLYIWSIQQSERTQSDHIICLKIKFKRGRLSVGLHARTTCGSNTYDEVKFQIETPKIERVGIAAMPLVLITIYFEVYTHIYTFWLMYRKRFFVISLLGWRIGQCTGYRSCPCAFRIVYTNSHLDRERQFCLLSYRFLAKKSLKNTSNFECSWISRRDEPHSQAVWTCIINTTTVLTNMTRATTTTVIKIPQMYGILHHQQT